MYNKLTDGKQLGEGRVVLHFPDIITYTKCGMNEYTDDYY